MLEQAGSNELLNVVLALQVKITELEMPGCALPKNRTMRDLASRLRKDAKRLPVQEILYFISSDPYFAYNKSKEVLANFKGLVEGSINVEFKDANGMSINNPFIKEEQNE